MHCKRNRSTSASPEATSQPSAKAPRTSSPAALPPAAPIPTLHLSSLIFEWDSEPCTVCVDGGPGDPDFLGRYVAGPDTQVIATTPSWSSEHDAFVYTPTTPMTLRYTRKTFTGTVGSDITYYGTMAGFYDDGVTIGPLLRLHAVGEAAFPEVLRKPKSPDDPDSDDDDRGEDDNPSDEDEDPSDEDDEEIEHWQRARCGPGPPYDFYDNDWLGRLNRMPSCIGAYALNVGEPDLPGQPDDGGQAVLTEWDEDGQHVESDGAEWNGWQGAWVSELLDRAARKVEQETRVGVHWRDWGRVDGFRIVNEKMWGVEFEFKPIAFETYELYPDSEPDKPPPKPKINLSAYTVEATVRRIFVKPKWFEVQDEE